ncbi:3-oxoacyl-ACP synthase III family protein [Croceimicrobium sp.]|uniref:3-oxoacyl-ACP synthase III family protein n=1 Tax=Croceimicrobium sp. TaxID=2828340 RepID=UPI003BAA003C
MNLEITGTGSCIPELQVPNQNFSGNEFYTREGERINQEGEEIIRKFQEITGIRERRYARPDQQTSDLATIAAQRAIDDAGIDPETLDGIIFAHNFGNIPQGKIQSDILPSLATRVKHDLKIKNPNCIAFDILYGCPGWVQAVILAYNYILAGQGKHYLVIGAETLSRKLDPHDRDSMIFSDGAGAAVVEAIDKDLKKGILSTASQTFTEDEAYYLNYGESNKQDVGHDTRYIKMQGQKIYQFALTHVPAAMKLCLDRSGLSIGQVKKVLIHQANEKMDEAIIKRFFRLYRTPEPEGIMPMSIHLLGNSSVATVPTLLDLLRRGELEGHELNEGDVILLASVGAGMSINAITYRV